MRTSLPLLLLLFLSFPCETSFGQCGAFFQGDTLIVNCGDSVTLEPFSDSLDDPLHADFNGDSIDPGFISNSNPDIDTTCGKAPDGTLHAWFGPNSTLPRSIRTIDTNMTNAEKVCFDLRLAADDGSGAPCEGPDHPDEGVYLQYSTDGGSTWNDIFFFNPDTNNAGGGPGSPFNPWKNYCFSIPSGAKTSSTRIRLYQPTVTDPAYDHWGVDNFKVYGIGSDTSVVYDWGKGMTNDRDSSFLPTDSSTISAQIIDTVANDTCTASAFVGYKSPSIAIDPQSPVKCSNDSLSLSVDGIQADCDHILNMKDSYGDGWNGAYITIYRNGDSIGSFSASGPTTTDTIEILGKDGISFEYHAGSFESENTYYFIAPNGDTLFEDGPSPQTGLVYSETFQCADGSGYSFDWTPSDGLSDTTSVYTLTGTDTPITYTVTVRDSSYSFCQDRDTVKVDTSSPPNVTLGPDTAFCMDDSVTLGIASANGYAWVAWDNNASIDSIVVDSSDGASPQQHWVTVTDSNGCKSSDSIEVTALDLPIPQLGADTAICPNDSILLDPGSFSAYQWTNGSTDSSLWIVNPDSSWAQGKGVTVIDSNGCSDTDSIKVNTLDTPNAQLRSDTSLCPDDSVLLDPGSFSTYQWTNGSSDSSIWVTGHDSSWAQGHAVTVTNSAGCTDKDSIMIGGLPEPSVQLPSDTDLCASDSLSLYTSSPSPLWDDGTTNSFHVVDSSHAGLGKSVHWLHSINASGCEDRDSILVDISICNKLKEHEEKLSVKILPNPASEQVRIRFQDHHYGKEFEIGLFDPEGRKILQKEGVKGKQEALLDVSELAAGSYILILRSDQASLVEKLIVK